jgi:hypothetical protein
MSSPAPILNTSLPSTFRQIRIELAREQEHPEGAHNIAYVLVAPLDDDGHIDAETWRRHREACRVARLRPGEATARGHLVHRRGVQRSSGSVTANRSCSVGSVSTLKPRLRHISTMVVFSRNTWP